MSLVVTTSRGDRHYHRRRGAANAEASMREVYGVQGNRGGESQAAGSTADSPSSHTRSPPSANVMYEEQRHEGGWTMTDVMADNPVRDAIHSSAAVMARCLLAPVSSCQVPLLCFRCFTFLHAAVDNPYDS